MANVKRKTIHIPSLSGGSEDYSLGSAEGTSVGLQLDISGLDNDISSIDMIQSNDGTNWYKVGSIGISGGGVSDGNYYLSTNETEFNTALYSGIRIAKGSASTGTIEVIEVIK